LKQSQKLLSDENIKTLGKILDNIEQMTAKGDEIEDKVILSLDEFRASLAKINKDFKKLQEDFAEIKEVSVPTIDKLMETSKDFNRVTLKVENSLERGDYNLQQIFEPMLIEIRILTNQLTAMSRQLEQNPNELLFKSRKLRKGPGE